MFNIVCGGPGPHDPSDGVLGTSDVSPTYDMRCNAKACIKPEAPAVVNRRTIQQRAGAALTANTAYLASNPTAAQVKTQTDALTRQVNGLLRVMANLLDDGDS